MTKKKVCQPSIRERAHRYASKAAPVNAAPTWTEGEQGSYWWGLYEGYQAGLRARKRK